MTTASAGTNKGDTMGRTIDLTHDGNGIVAREGNVVLGRVNGEPIDALTDSTEVAFAVASELGIEPPDDVDHDGMTIFLHWYD